MLAMRRWSCSWERCSMSSRALAVSSWMRFSDCRQGSSGGVSTASAGLSVGHAMPCCPTLQAECCRSAASGSIRSACCYLGALEGVPALHGLHLQ